MEWRTDDIIRPDCDGEAWFRFLRVHSICKHFKSKGTEDLRSLHVQSPGNLSCDDPFLSAQLACTCICVHGCTVLNIITSLQLHHWVFILAICSLVKMCICHILMIFFMIKGFYQSLYLFLSLRTTDKTYLLFLLLYFSFRWNKFYFLCKSWSVAKSCQEWTHINGTMALGLKSSGGFVSISLTCS